MSKKDQDHKKDPLQDQDSYLDNSPADESIEGEVNEGPPEGNEDLQRQITAMAYQGPIPPASEFERYERTLPGTGDRILTMAENTQENNNKLRRREQLLFYFTKFSAQLIVLIIALFIIAGGFYLISGGKSIEGFAAIIFALGSFAGSMIWGKKHLTNGNNKEK